MGCCRQPTRGGKQARACDILEKAGSSFLLWPKVTNTGITLTVRTASAGFIELSSFLAAFGCSGPVASLLRRNISNILSIPSDYLSPYTRSGVSIAIVLVLASK